VKKLKVMTVVGTRPEIIRLSRVMARLDDACEHVLVHTGQNYDYELNEVFFKELGLRKPDAFFGLGGLSLGETLGRVLMESEKVIAKEKPDAVLILGDTNSSLAAIMARRMKVPVYHMEAGNRSFDRNVPEETNRKIVDHIADFNLVYTEHARRHLIAEGLPQRRIYLTGSPMREVLEHYRGGIEASKILQELKLSKGEYFVASLHREENVDNRARLAQLLAALDAVAQRYSYPIIVSTHPRTRKRLEAMGEQQTHKRITFANPFGFFDYNALQKNAFCVISDSGTIAEEAAILQFPAITPRDAIERPEGLDAGCVVMTGLDEDAILNGIDAITGRFAKGDLPTAPEDYSIGDTSLRVLQFILGSTKLSNTWDGIRPYDC
jgi:UDP-N-acetylglucosamine 2-epimerase